MLKTESLHEWDLVKFLIFMIRYQIPQFFIRVLLILVLPLGFVLSIIGGNAILWILKKVFALEFVVIKEGNRIIAIKGINGWRKINITVLGVAGKWRQKGVATMLLNEVFAECLKKGKREVYLSVRKNNDPARELYKKMGFVEIRETFRSFKMRKDLSSMINRT